MERREVVVKRERVSALVEAVAEWLDARDALWDLGGSSRDTLAATQRLVSAEQALEVAFVDLSLALVEVKHEDN